MGEETDLLSSGAEKADVRLLLGDREDGGHSPEGATTTVEISRSCGRIKFNAMLVPALVPTHRHGDVFESVIYGLDL